MDSVCTHALDLPVNKKLAYYTGNHTTVRTEAMTETKQMKVYVAGRPG